MTEAVADGRTRRAEAQRESRRAEILQTALGVFATKGYHQTRISDIIMAAGIARGTFYLYFESKSAIFLELVDDLLGQLRATVIGVNLEPGAEPVETQLLETVTRVVQAVDMHRKLTTILFREAVGLDADVDKKLKDFYGNLHSFIADSLRNGQQLGIVRDLDADVVAACILGSVKYLLEQHTMNDRDPGMDAQRIGKGILDYNLHGILNTKNAS